MNLRDLEDAGLRVYQARGRFFGEDADTVDDDELYDVGPEPCPDDCTHPCCTE